MKVAVVGSRVVHEEVYALLEKYIPANASEIVSGGAAGVDKLAGEYARRNELKLTEFLPDYDDENLVDKKRAPLIRNQKIVEHADFVIAFWDGKSRGTAFTLDYAFKQGKPAKVVLLEKDK